MDVIEAIFTRRDLEAFAEECPPREVIASLLDAAVWAPNHLLTEPWRFHVVAGARREALTDAVARWLESTGAAEAAVRSMRGKVMRAPVTVFVIQSVSSDDPARMLEDYAACAAAIQNLLLAAHAAPVSENTARKLIAHFSTDRMLGYEATRAHLGIEGADRIVAMLNIGYLRDDASPTPKTRKPPVVRWDWA